MKEELICTYYCQRGRLTVQHLFNPQYRVDAEGNKTHIQGWCEKVTAPKTLRVDHVIEFHDTLTEANIYYEKAVEFFEAEGYEYEVTKPTRLSSPDTMDVCFTGFNKQDKANLSDLAAANGMEIRQSVTKHLDILCYGFNAGPKKLEKALAQGVLILNSEQLKTLIGTGELPEDV